MNDRQLLTRDLLVLFGLTGWALAIPSFASEFAVSMALTCLMYIALSTSWSLFCGSTRYLSLATSAFFGIGAYTSAIGLAGYERRLNDTFVLRDHRKLRRAPSLVLSDPPPHAARPTLRHSAKLARSQRVSSLRLIFMSLPFVFAFA